MTTHVLMLVTTITWAATGQAAETVFYVAPNGRDAWSGGLASPNARGTDGPFATLHRARDAVRQIKRARGSVLTRPVTVCLRGGTYRLDQPLTLTPEDSGSPECPVTYAAYKDETPVISGGVVITGWEQDGHGTWGTTLPEVKAGRLDFRQLFVRRQGQPDYQRRYRPSKGAFVIAGLTNAPVFKNPQRHRQSQDEFRFCPGDIERWHNLDDVEIVALHDWSASRLRIAKLDMDKHVVKFTGYPVYRIGHWWKDGRNPYYAENVKEAFGNPGEWYLNRPTGTLSYRPAQGEDMTRATVVAPRLENLVRLAGDVKRKRFVEHVMFRGITFCHTSWNLPEKGYSSAQGMVDLPAAIEAEGARWCGLESCTLAHLGAYAVRLGPGCRHNAVVGCRVFDLGGGGIMVGLSARSANDVPEHVLPAGNVVANNVISDGGLVHFSAHGIWVGIAARTRITHNVVRRFLYSTVSVGWSWNDKPTSCRQNLIEYNHIHDAMMLLADGGGIYTLGLQPGTTIRGNHIHAVRRSKFAGRAPNNGIFFDQGSKAFTVEGNVIYDTAGAPIRYNQSKQEWMTFRDNVLGISPESPGFPKDVADKAGLEPAFRHLLETMPKVPPCPMLEMALPGVERQAHGSAGSRPAQGP
ncbi:MAG: right-handed parallel beta-helix repeat-containing protein [Phycisphaerae bacterium]|nr:right-handed parallel beta-helix repeat-containing protein [Phycisphaerae bacterium]